MRPGLRRLATTIAVAAAVGCAADPVSALFPSPAFDAVVVEASSVNVLSAVVRVSVRDADSVAVHFHSGDAAAGDSTTPAVVVPDGGGVVVVPVLGLFAERHYSLRAVAFGRGGERASAALELTTDTLPSDLPRYVASGTDPEPGYIVFGAGRYGLAIDNTGRVAWYYRFPTGPGLDFTAQAGHYYGRRPTVAPADPSEWVEIDPLGNVTRTLGCLEGLTPRYHDVIVQPPGDYWLMCDETRTMDLSSVGGVVGARVTGTAVQHVSADGKLLFRWSPFDHFDITDGNPRDLAGPVVNWTHGNAIDLAPDGGLVVSFRNLSEITKIDTTSGRVVWRFGGRRNQFTMLEAWQAGSAGQHSVRVDQSGRLMMLDNVGDPAESHGEEYVLDEKAMSARLVGLYSATPRALTEIGGSVQRLPRGHVLVSFGTAGRVVEYDGAIVAWRIDGDAGYIFRAQRIRSLYSPGVGTTR